jgi:hypothetical protein
MMSTLNLKQDQIRTDMSTRKVLLISDDFPEPLCDYESIGLTGTSLSVA